MFEAAILPDFEAYEHKKKELRELTHHHRYHHIGCINGL